MPTNENIPPINWPEEEGDYKAVQFVIDENPYLCICDKTMDHETILEEFLYKFQIFPEIDEENPDPRLQSLLSLEGERYKVPGMGWVYVETGLKKAYLSGNSSAYDIDISKEHVDMIRPLASDWTLEIE